MKHPNFDPVEQAHTLVPWLAALSDGHPRLGLESRIQAGEPIGELIATSLGVKRSVVKHMFCFADDVAHIPLHPAHIADTLATVAPAFWPRTSSEWDTVREITRSLHAYGADDNAVVVALPALITIHRRLDRAGILRRPDPRHWAGPVRVLHGHLARLMGYGVPTKGLGRRLAHALISQRLENPRKLLTAIEIARRAAFEHAALGCGKLPERIELPLPEIHAGDWSLVPLTTVADLRVEGRSMQHCLGAYRLHLIAGEGLYFSLRHKGRSRTTIEFHLFGDVPGVCQGDIRGRANETEHGKVAAVLTELCPEMRNLLPHSRIRQHIRACRRSLRDAMIDDWHDIEVDAIRGAVPDSFRRNFGVI